MYTEKHYNEVLSTFRELVLAAINVSEMSGKINTSTLGVEATKIYTRLTLNCMTIQNVLPNSSGIWDFPSLAVLIRSYIETSHRYFYLSEKGLSEDEAEFRRHLYFYHLNMEKFRLFSTKPEHEILNEFKEKLPKALIEIKALPFFKELTKYYKNKITAGNADMHISDEIISRKNNLINDNFSFYYRLLSNHAHGSPFATTSQSDERGRGLKNEAELFYVTLIMNITNKYLSATIKQQIELLSLQQKCQNELSVVSRHFDKIEV